MCLFGSGYLPSKRQCGGSNHCFVSNIIFLCGRDLKYHIYLQTECSPVIMVTSAMFELLNFNLLILGISTPKTHK